MPANVETAAFSNIPAWHQEGVVLDTDGNKGMTVEVALDVAGLDWEVAKVPVFAPAPGEDLEKPMQFVPVANQFGVQRSTDGKILGVVGRVYECVQNREGFDLLETMLGQDEQPVWIEAAGALDGGSRVWVLAHVEAELFIAGEEIAQYILFTTSHDGRSSVTAALTDVRVVCQNTLSWALDTTPRVFRVRHTCTASERIQQAQDVLGLRSLRAEELARQGEWLVNQEMSDKDFDRFLETLMPTPLDKGTGEPQDGTPAATMIANRRDDVRSIYKGADNLNDIRGTRWGALNAVVEYADYGRDFRDSETQLKAQFRDQAVKQQALQVLLEA